MYCSSEKMPEYLGYLSSVTYPRLRARIILHVGVLDQGFYVVVLPVFFDVMDLFDDALAETAMLVPSQDITTAAGHAATPSDCIVILDDVDEHCAEALSQAPEDPSQALVQLTCEIPPCTKRASAQANHQAMPKRTCSRKKALNIMAWEKVEGDVVTCALVPSGKTVVLVPLWGQYTVDCKELGMPNCKWIVVSNYERWVMQLVNLITNKSRLLSQRVHCLYGSCSWCPRWA